MNYKKYLEDQLQTSIEAADHKSVYYALLHLTKELCKEKTANQGTSSRRTGRCPHWSGSSQSDYLDGCHYRPRRLLCHRSS